MVIFLITYTKIVKPLVSYFNKGTQILNQLRLEGNSAGGVT